MPFNRYLDLDPVPGETLSEELAVTDDVLVKVFALGPDAVIPPHDHPDSTNVFHVLQGSTTVIQDGAEELVEAPAVILNERGVEHGVRNDSDDIVILTASLSPSPG